MATVHDVAAYILGKCGPMTAMKLQKLVYYSQAWGLVWDERPLFAEQIEAWANGPVVRDLYDKHPRAILMPDAQQARPCWRISRLEMIDPYGWHILDAGKASEVRQKLGQFESMTWHEILVVAQKQHHTIPVEDLCKKAQDRLAE